MSTKIHALVEGLGNPARWSLTAGQTHDITQAQALLEGLEFGVLVADTAYDANALLERIEGSGATAVIPPRAYRREPRNFDAHRYRDRNLIERFFCRMKHFRRIATRYEKLACRFSAFIAIVAAFIWLA